MKLLFLIFIIYINYSLSKDTSKLSKKIIVKTFPKKVSPGFIKYHVAGTYVKPGAADAKKKGSLKDYTVFAKPFPKSKQDQQQIVPDSPYFPVSTSGQVQKRVKKVLPEYVPVLGARFKRSAAENVGENDRRLKFPHKRPKRKDGGQRSKSPVKQSSKKVDNAKRSKTVEVSGKNVAKAKKPKHTNIKTLRQPPNIKKKRDLTNRTPSHSANLKKHKVSAASGRSQKLKSTKKRIGKREGPSQKKSKSVPGKKLKSVRNSPNKKLSQAQSSRTSKNKVVRNRKGPDARRLIAARDALVEDYPYVVSFQKDDKHWCAGALLNPRLTITTANCLWRSNSISRMRVRACSRHTDRGGQLAKIQEVMKHPGWKLRTDPDTDVALVLIDRPIRFSHSCHGVDLPNRIMMPAFDDAWITSWGADRRDGIYETRGMSLQVYHARLIEREKCNNVTQRYGVTVTENFICLAQTGRRAPCTRDTGAPAVSDGVLWGLASWGIRKLCGTERFPAMFSYLASRNNMDFIANATRFLMADERYYPFGDRYPMPKVPLVLPTPVTLPY